MSEIKRTPKLVINYDEHGRPIYTKVGQTDPDTPPARFANPAVVNPTAPDRTERRAIRHEDMAQVAKDAPKKPGKFKEFVREHATQYAIIGGIAVATVAAIQWGRDNIHSDNHDYTQPTIDLGTEAAPDPDATYPNSIKSSVTLHQGDAKSLRVLFYDGTVEDTNTGQVTRDPIVVQDPSSKELFKAEYDRDSNKSVTLGLSQKGTMVWKDTKGKVVEHPTTAVTAEALPEIVSTYNAADPKHPSKELYIFDTQHLPTGGLVINPQRPNVEVPGLLNQDISPR